jgi:hypothetical protein
MIISRTLALPFRMSLLPASTGFRLRPCVLLVTGAVGTERALEPGGSQARMRPRRAQPSGSVPPGLLPQAKGDQQRA